MRKKSVTRLKTCRICSSTQLYDFLDLGEQPIPNGFLKREELDKAEEKYPLSVMLCENCYLVQLRHLVHPKVMFDNYLYIPSASKTRLDDFKDIATESATIVPLNEDSLVVDIGSNDGSLLNCYKNMGVPVLGVDPAENLVAVAELNGIPTVHAYFTAKQASKLIKKYKNADVMLATNVFAHIGELHDFMKGVEIALDDNGIFITQFPYLLDLIEKNQFDTIYHEHLSYFSLRSLLELEKHSGLEILNIRRNTLDGGSVRVFWKKKKNKKLKKNTKAIQDLLTIEKNSGLYTKEVYDTFAQRVENLKEAVKKKLVELKKKKKTIVGYGAAAKGNVLLNYFDINTDIFEYLVDSTPYKQGLYSPGTHIPIFEEAKIYETRPDYIVILAWNFQEEIMNKNEEFKKKGGHFILTMPELRII